VTTAQAIRRLTHVTHPLVQHKLSYLRDKDTPTVHFRKLVDEVTLLLTYEATKDFPIEEVEIETPLERATVPRISARRSPSALCREPASACSTASCRSSPARASVTGLYRDEDTPGTPSTT
jgi:uracil phosphoribosyltransferase